MHGKTDTLYWPKLDGIGIGLSFICAIHCLITPLTLALLPLMGIHTHDNKSIEAIMVLLIIMVGILALMRGYLNHKKWQVFIYLTLGIVIFVFIRPVFDNTAYNLATLLGGFSFMVGHLYNWNWCRACPLCRESKDHCQLSNHPHR